MKTNFNFNINRITKNPQIIEAKININNLITKKIFNYEKIQYTMDQLHMEPMARM